MSDDTKPEVDAILVRGEELGKLLKSMWLHGAACGAIAMTLLGIVVFCVLAVLK